LKGLAIPADLALPATDGPPVALGRLVGRTVVFAYPRSGTPLVPLADWDAIPGARGCTPHACAFRDRVEEFKKLGLSLNLNSLHLLVFAENN
jgi:peroxiredoxin (alkyl hydroperoxide reductase subunit C)